MSESKLTPGPWLITPDGAFVYALNERGTNVFWTHVQRGWKGKDAEFRTSSEEVEANAKLIAAAPCLLEALQALEQIKDIWLPQEAEEGFAEEMYVLHKARNNMLAAIAKAIA